MFVPGFFITFAQGLALPNAQAGAMQVSPSLAGTAAGIGVFCQMFIAALFAQLCGWAADRTPAPMIAIAGVAALFTLGAGAVPALRRRPVQRP